MAEAFVQLPANSSGTKLRTFEQTVGANVVDHQAVVLCDSASNIIGSLASAPTGTEQALLVRPIQTDISSSGTITTTDAVVAAPAGAGAMVSGASTAGSLFALATNGGDSAWNVMITGLTSGTLYFEESMDSTTGTDGNWINVNGRQTGIVNTILAGNSTANGYWRGNTSGAKWFRVRSVGALTGTPLITVRISDGVGAVFLNAGIPPGSDEIGRVRLTDGTNLAAVKAASTAAVAADPSLVVTVHPTSGPTATQPVSLATNTPDVTDRSARLLGVLSAGANEIGRVRVTDGTNIGAVKAASTAAVAADPSQVVSLHPTSPLPAGASLLGIVNSQVPLNQSVDGAGAVQPLQFAYFNVSTAQTGVSLIAAPAAGRAIRVLSYAIVVGTTMNVSFIGASSTLLYPLVANAGVSFAGSLQGPAFQLATATALTYTTSAAGQATGHICYAVV